MKAALKVGLALFAATAFVVSTHAAAQEKLTVWWVRGSYKSEDDALLAAIKKYEDKTGVKVELSQYLVQDMIPKTVVGTRRGHAARRRVRSTSTTSRSRANGRSTASSRT